MQKYFQILLAVLLGLLVNRPVLAQKTFSDDFSGTLDKWQLVNGLLSYWQISNQALYGNITSSRKLSTIVPKDEFWQGMDEYTVDFVFKVFDSTDKNFVVGMRDAGNFYDFHFYSNHLIIEDIRNGFSIHSMSVPFVLQLNRDYLVHFSYTKEKIELLIDGVKVFATDKFWALPVYGGKFGLKVSTGSLTPSKVFFDQVEVREASSRDVFFKQNDALWSGEIYDHADLWSTRPLMSNWGCALSSAAMMLRFYGHYLLPNGEIINPKTLNQWLLDQADGYVAEGLVNWLAITRLSKTLSDAGGNLLPKLEFSYFKGSDEENLAKLKENLPADQVQIAAIIGHFFLITNYLADQNDFAIKDPLFDYALLSARPEKVESLRLFKPSFTDLSYLLLVLPDEIDFSLLDEAGQNLTDVQVVDETIISDQEKVGEPYKLIYYAKPNDGQMNLALHSVTLNQELLGKAKLFIYQANGEVQLVNPIELFDASLDFDKVSQLLINIDYLKDGVSVLSTEVIDKTSDELKQEELSKVAEQSKLDFEAGKLSFYLFYQLNLLIDSLREHLAYFFLLQKFLDFHGL